LEIPEGLMNNPVYRAWNASFVSSLILRLCETDHRFQLLNEHDVMLRISERLSERRERLSTAFVLGVFLLLTKY
jgi:hypothetical protein